jgi:hypothetical protein
MSGDSDFLKRRRDRAIAIVLGVKEREIDQYLPEDVRQRFRKIVLDQFNDMYDACLDVTRSQLGDQVILNELYKRKIDRIAEDINSLLGREDVDA